MCMKIVAKNLQLGLSFNIAEPLFTPVDGGDYLLAFYITSAGGSSGSGSVAVSGSWVDEFGAQSSPPVTLAVGSSGPSYASAIFPVRSIPLNAIGYATTVATLPVGAVYDMTIELIDLAAPGL
jgi:hypothetical protein